MSTDSHPTPPPGPPPGAPARPPGEDFFDKIRALGISRPDQGRWAAGVCAGIARRLGVDPLLIRGIFVVLMLVGGMGLFLYGVGWAFLPEEDGRIHAQQALRGDISAGLVGAVVLMLLDLGRDSGPWWNFGWWHGGFFPFGPLRFGGLITVVVVGVVVWWLLTRHGGGGTGGGGGAGGGGAPPTGAPPPGYAPPAYGPPGYGPPGYGPPAGPGPGQPPPAGFGASASPYAAPSAGVARSPAWTAPPDPAAPSHVLTQVTLGAALLAAGLAALWDRQVSDLPGPTWLLAAGVALGVLAIGVIVAGVLGRRAGGLAPVGILLACVVLLGAVLPAHGSVSRFGAITWRPQTTAQAEGGLSAGGREAMVDLTAPGITAGATPLDPVRVHTWLGVGQLQITVPRDRPMEIRTSVGAGDVIDSTGVSSAGASLSDTIHTGGAGAPLAVVTARVGLGEIHVMYDTGVTQ